MKNNKNIKYFLIIGIALLLLIIIGFGYFKFYKNVEPLNNNEIKVGESLGLENIIDENITQKEESLPVENKIEASIEIKNNTPVVKETPKVVLPTLTLSLVKNLVVKTWRKCPNVDCESVEVTLGKDNLVTAVYDDISDSVGQSKYEGFVIAKDGKWVLEKASITQTCTRDHMDGSFGFSPSPCI